ncbi:glycosyltransferase [Nocardioides bruguierae]|uniref:Glycosyl transferase family 28 C-terminal domain-containing protein n=1 Tax=Nocardioides bruguierae TaxID=2945102 RepID=A0A9X2IED6_9ACTN|nr:glycosyltransferase [Nocardioides bruguierae]MCM0619943.1 hypothetical protein [Nocardioides bruguierae]
MSITAPSRPETTAPVVLRRAKRRAPAPQVLPDALPLLRDGGTGPVMLVSSGGGHFAELRALADAWGIDPVDRHWVVPRTGQTKDVTADGGTVTFVPRIASREMTKAAAGLARALMLHRRVRPAVVLSAGALQAVPHLVAAAAFRTPVVYVESVARLDRPSLTGRLAASIPGSRLFHQSSATWAGTWLRAHDIYSGFAVETHTVARAPRSLAVLLGTEQFGFTRLVDDVLAAAPTTPVTWQVGNTDCRVAGEQPQRWLSAQEMLAGVRDADVVVTHGGAGSVLTALEAGHVPVVVPRCPERGEHVDDHQIRMCRELAERGLVVLVEPGETLTSAHLAEAARKRAVPARFQVARVG